MQKVLVAGGAGFIGSNLTEAFLKKGYQVVCIDNMSLGNTNNLNMVMQKMQEKQSKT
jgi:UDP-N-acetylglucosamine 4-epimerase